MKADKKLDILQKSSACLNKIKYYEDNIEKMTNMKNTVTAELTIKTSGIKNTIWVDITRAEAIGMLMIRLKQEKDKLNKLKNMIKL